MTERVSKIVSWLGTRTVTQESIEPIKQKSGYIYTKDDHSDALSDEQRLFYDREGYLIVRGMFSPEQVRVWNDHFIELCNNKRKRNPRMIVMNDINAKHLKKIGVKNITKFQDFEEDEIFMNYCKDENIQNIARAFCGPNINSVHTMLINKPPDLGRKSSRHPLHQDLWYFPFRPTNEIVASWTALQHVDRENGGLCVLPGSHHHYPGGELRRHEYPVWPGGVNKMYHTVADNRISMKALEGKLVYPTMEAGDAIFFHPLLIHGSNLNNTSSFRKSICSHFCSSDCYYIDIPDGTFQQLIKDELIEVNSGMKTKKGRAIMALLGEEYRPTFDMIWRAKTAHVRGRKGSMSDFRDFFREQQQQMKKKIKNS